MKRYLWTIIITALALSSLKADQRSYVWTYEYMIVQPGESEFEQYTTFATTDTDLMDETTSTELNFELEVGMHKNFDFAVYQVFSQDPMGSFKYKGFKLRTRYIIGEKDQFFVNPLIYLEYKGKPGFKEHEIETKFILAKDFGDFNISLNPYFEIEMEDDETEFELKYAGGLNYKFSKLFSAGLEFKGDEYANYIGPTFAHGVKDLWLAIGNLWSVGSVKEGKPEYMLRLILGVGL